MWCLSCVFNGIFRVNDNEFYHYCGNESFPIAMSLCETSFRSKRECEETTLFVSCFLSFALLSAPLSLSPSTFLCLPFSVSIVLPCCTPFPQQIIYATENQACVVYLIDFHVYMNRLYLQMQSLVDNFSASVALNSLSRLCKPHNTQFFNFYSMFLSISNTTNDVNAKFAVNVNKQLRKKYTQPKQREKKTKINWNH